MNLNLRKPSINLPRSPAGAAAPSKVLAFISRDLRTPPANQTQRTRTQNLQPEPRSLRVRSRTHVRRGLHATARARPRHGATPATPSDRPAQKTDHPRKRRGAANLRVLSTAPLVAGAAVVVVDPGVARGQRQRRLIGLVHTRRRRKHSRLRRNPDVRLHYALPTWRRLA